jgi:hypothetical protein
MTNNAKTIIVGQNLVSPSESFMKMPPTVKKRAAAMTIPANIATFNPRHARIPLQYGNLRAA